MKELKKMVEELDREYNEETEKKIAQYCYKNFAYLKDSNILEQLEEKAINEVKVLDFRPTKEYKEVNKIINNILYDLTFMFYGWTPFYIDITNKKDLFYYSCDELDFYFKKENTHLINDLMKKNLYLWAETVLTNTSRRN